MTIENLEGQTLRQKLSHADQLARELLELLEHGVIPKMHDLRRTAKQGLDTMDSGNVTDLTMRSVMENVLHSGKSARENADLLMTYLNSIESDLWSLNRRQK